MKRYTEAEMQRVKDSNPISGVIGPYVTWDKAKSNPSRGDYWAPCPFHAEKTASFHCEDGKHFYKCFGCGSSGDQFKFLMECTGKTFPEAMEILGGQADPEPLTPEQIAADQEARRKKRIAGEQAERRFREEERRKAHGIWKIGGPVKGTEGVDYLRGRGLLPCPVKLPLRFHPHFTYWHPRQAKGKKKPDYYTLFSGPVMLAAITRPDGKFAGVHITYIDPARPGEKIRIEDPEAEPSEDGMPSYVPAKKIRGSKLQASIKLVTPDRFDRLVMGEGWETTASVMVAEHGTERFARTAYWVAIDLQSMGGKARETVPHPEQKTKTGRPVRIPGPDPDMDDPRAIPIPSNVRELVLLGDGDSDRFTAEQVMKRAQARYADPGRTVTPIWAPDGMDFNDILKQARETA